MYLVSSSSYPKRLAAADELERRIPSDLIEDAWVDDEGVHHSSIYTVLSQFLVPEIRGEPPKIELFHLARTLDELVELQYISAETAHNTFSLISPCVSLELFSLEEVAAPEVPRVPVCRQAFESLQLF